MALAQIVQDAAVRGVGALLSWPAKHAKFTTLLYHRVFREPDPLLAGEVDVPTFEWQMEVLKRHFNILPLPEAAARLVSDSLPPRAVCLTFDDGYADNYELVLPILKKKGIPATFFISVGFLDGGRMWNDTVIESVRRARDENLDLRGIGLGSYRLVTLQDRAVAVKEIIGRFKYLPLDERTRYVETLAEVVGEDLPTDLMMSSEQIRRLHAEGMDIGAHTVNHPILSRLPPGQAEKEIFESRDLLREITGGKITSFAYPNGQPGIDYDRSHVEMVMRCGFSVATSSTWGCARQATDLLQVPRIGVWGSTPLRYSSRILQAYMSRRPKTV